MPLIPVLVVVFLIFLSIRIVPEYDRIVIFVLGRMWRVGGPGPFIVVPGLMSAQRVSLRTVAFDVPPQDIITKDNITMKVNAVIYFRVIDPEKAILQVENYIYATSQLAQ